MEAVLIKSGSIILMIASGYLFKKWGIVKESDARTIMKIMMNITLPASLMLAFQGLDLQLNLLFYVAIGIGCNLFTCILAYIMTHGKDGITRAFCMLNLSSYNIGAFTLPFVQAFFGNAGLIVASMFDMGNAIMGCGSIYAAASTMSGKGHFTFKQFFRTIFSSPPFDIYVFMMLLSLFHLELPDAVFSVAQNLGNANCFLAMFALGVLFQFRIERDLSNRAFTLIGIRYLTGIVLASAVWFLLPFSEAVRHVLMLCCLAPVISAAPSYTDQCGGDIKLSGIINAMCIPISTIVFTILLLIWA